MGISAALGSSALLPAGLGFRNVIINGGFDVWQRGTTASIPIDGSPSSTSYLADRWSAFRNTTGSTQSRVAAGLDGFRYAMRVQRNSGNTDQSNGIYISQSFETSTMVKLAGKRVALSFYARAGANWSSTASRLRGTLQSGSGTEANMIYDGIDNGIYGANVSIDLNVGLTTSWQLFTLTGLIPSGVNSGGLSFEWLPQGTPAGAADYFEITGVQLEANTMATPFEQRPIGVELALCQRYYQRTTSTAGDQTFAAGMYLNTTLPLGALMFPVMRTAPTITFNGTYDTVTSGAGLITTGVAAGNITSTTAQLSGTCSGAVAGGGTIFRQDSGYFDMSAEL